MRILGVDPGSRVCGYAVIEVLSRECRYVECGVLTANERLPMEARLGEIARGLQEVIGELEPGLMGVEDVFSHVNPRSALALAQARGMVLAVAGMSGITVCSYAPAVVKKTVTGRGRASKEQVARMVQALVGLGSAPRADAADALAVAITCAHLRELGAAR
ncbi:MAG TPA: crossover junction endodeoxyribonuclease RuvC [Kofleriaceae bacterium]|nr:crossover junction endodeoxyribonuclease RuvC [Kofleriaceae bacterium]